MPGEDYQETSNFSTLAACEKVGKNCVRSLKVCNRDIAGNWAWSRLAVVCLFCFFSGGGGGGGGGGRGRGGEREEIDREGGGGKGWGGGE